MSTLNDLHGKVPAPPVHVVALGFNGPWEVMTMKVRLATCRDRNVADYIAALWNLMPAVDALEGVRTLEFRPEDPPIPRNISPQPTPRPYRRRKAGKSVQVVP